MNYGFVIEELRLLRRGIVLVDSEGIIRFVDYLEEITDQIDFDKVFFEEKETIMKQIDFFKDNKDFIVFGAVVEKGPIFVMKPFAIPMP